MKLAERIRAIMLQEYGITTDKQLLEAIENMNELDIGIFTAALNAKDEKEEFKKQEVA